MSSFRSVFETVEKGDACFSNCELSQPLGGGDSEQ